MFDLGVAISASVIATTVAFVGNLSVFCAILLFLLGVAVTLALLYLNDEPPTVRKSARKNGNGRH